MSTKKSTTKPEPTPEEVRKTKSRRYRDLAWTAAGVGGAHHLEHDQFEELRGLVKDLGLESSFEGEMDALVRWRAKEGPLRDAEAALAATRPLTEIDAEIAEADAQLAATVRELIDGAAALHAERAARVAAELRRSHTDTQLIAAEPVGLSWAFNLQPDTRRPAKRETFTDVR